MLKEKTQELFAACKKAGYKHLTIFCANENVPESVEVEQSKSGYWVGGRPFLENNVPHLVCASPPQRGESSRLAVENWPKIWEIVKDLKLNFHGAGYGDCFPIQPEMIGDLDAGYYDLTT